MKRFSDFNYWFNLRPASLQPLTQKLFIALLILFFILLLTIALIKRRAGIYRGLLKRLSTFLLTNFLVGLLFLFFNYELVPFLSARFWLGLWILGMIVWLVFVAKSLFVLPRQRQALAREKEMQKYLP